MKSVRTAFFLLLAAAWLLPAVALPVAAQESQDNQPHITPRKEEKEKRPVKPATPPRTEPQNSQTANPQPTEPPDTDDGYPQGVSSSKDSQVDFNAGPRAGSAAALAEEDHPYDPHRAEKDVEVGNYYLKQKNYRAALERFHDALLYKPKDAEATYGLAVTQEKMELLSQAYQNYKNYLQILPEGEYAKACEEAIQRLEPRVGKANLNSADVTRATAKSEEGEKFLANNDFAAARQSFEEALRLTPDNPAIHFHLAQSLEGLQQLDPARMHYQKYLEMDPSGPFAADAKKGIARIRDILGK